MSTSQNHCYGHSVTKPKALLLTKQILSSKVVIVTSKDEAHPILNSVLPQYSEPAMDPVLSNGESELEL